MNVLYCSLCCCVSCWYSCSFSFLASLVWNKINTNLALNLTTLKFNRELEAKLVYSAETELKKKMLPLISYAYFSDRGTLADPFPNMSRAHTHTASIVFTLLYPLTFFPLPPPDALGDLPLVHCCPGLKKISHKDSKMGEKLWCQQVISWHNFF